jgi:hypothetical protein
MKLYFVLHNAQQAVQAMRAALEQLRPWLIAGHKFELAIKPETRSGEQNRKFHALCQDLERARVPWFNAPRSAAEWKVLLVSGHAIATKEGANIIPGLEGEMVNIRESTALMSRARSSSLIEYATAFCAEHMTEQEA